MRYIDTGSRDPAHALGTWMRATFQPEVAEIRCQSGFFSADSMGLLVSTLARFVDESRIAHFVIGSNEGGTTCDDVRRLMQLLGIPRPDARLGVVRFGGGAFFHPKVYHLRRVDGSQCAYVGSANLSASGVASLHIEAGVTLDTREGDAEDVLEHIAKAVDAWFDSARPGIAMVVNQADINRLTAAGDLARGRPPRTRPGAIGAAVGANRPPPLQPLIRLPAVAGAGTAPDEARVAVGIAAALGPAPAVASVRHENYPPYLWFDPDAVSPSSGRDALSGILLPEAAAGLVIRLTKDNARHFVSETVGTSNFTVPVRTAETLRFGFFQGKYARPRAEYPLRMRYLADPETVLGLPLQTTSVMPYGFREGEKGHGDLRLVIPAAVRGLAERLKALQLPLPGFGDVALVEWPTVDAPEFRLSYLERGSTLFKTAEALFESAAASRHLVGKSTCWLPEGTSPPWP